MFQCRDESFVRSDVRWSRPGKPMPPGYSDVRGRLAIPDVQVWDPSAVKRSRGEKVFPGCLKDFFCCISGVCRMHVYTIFYGRYDIEVICCIKMRFHIYLWCPSCDFAEKWLTLHF